MFAQSRFIFEDAAHAEFERLYEARTHCSLPHLVSERNHTAAELKRVREEILHISTKSVSGERRRNKGTLQLREKVLIGQLRNCEQELEAHSLNREMIREMYLRMRDVPRVTSIEVNAKHGRIYVTTDTLFGKHTATGVWHRFNPVRATIKLPPVGANPAVAMVSISWECPRKVIRHQEWLTPQALCGGGACLGEEATLQFGKALIAHDYAGMVSIAVRFAECHHFVADKRMWPVASMEELPEWYLKTFGP